MNKPVYVMEAHFIEKQIQIAVQELYQEPKYFLLSTCI